MERIFSIKELKIMIKAIKTDNPHYKTVGIHACGIFRIGEVYTLEHRHIGNQEYKKLYI